MPRGPSQAISSQASPNIVHDSQPISESEYEARAILDQRYSNRRLQYLIDWVGTDADGQPYEPTWEPEANCSKGLVDGWKKRITLDPMLVGRYASQEEARRKRKSDGKRKVPSEATSTENTPQKPVNRTAKRSRIVESQSDQAPTSLTSHAEPSPARRHITPSNTESPHQPTRSKLRKGSTARPKNLGAPATKSNSGTPQAQRLEVEEMTDKKRRVGFAEAAAPSEQMAEDEANDEPGRNDYLEPAAVDSQQTEEEVAPSDPEDYAASQDYMAGFSESQADALHRVVDLLTSQMDQMDESDNIFAVTAPEGMEVQGNNGEGDATANTSIIPDSQVEPSVPSGTPAEETASAHMNHVAVGQSMEMADTSVIQSTPQEASSADISRQTDESMEMAVDKPATTEEGLTVSSSADQQERTPELNPLTAVVEERDQTIASLQVKITSLQKTIKNQASDLDFQRNMYNQASNQAVGLANDLRSARDEVKKLKDQLDRGLKQKDAFHTAQTQSKDQKIQTLEKQVTLLLAQNRATNDEVRSRASDYPNVVAMNTRLRRELDDRDEEVELYTSLVKTYKKKIEKLRGPRMGRLPRLTMMEAEEEDDDESSSDEDFDPESEEDDDEDEPFDTDDEEEIIIKGLTDVPVMAAPPAQAVVATEVFQQPTGMDTTSFVQPLAQQLSQPDLAHYVICRWAEVPQQQCGYLSQSHEDMDMHVVSHIPSDE